MPSAVFSADEIARIRHHLGYLAVQPVYTFAFGIPAAVHPNFSFEKAVTVLMVESQAKARQLLCRLDAMEDELYCGAGDFAATSKIGEIELRGADRVKELLKLYVLAQTALANMLGCVPNPFDQRNLGQGGINVPVY